MSVMAGVPRLAMGLGLLLVRQASKWKEDLIIEEGFVRKSLDLLVGSLHPSLTASQHNNLQRIKAVISLLLCTSQAYFSFGQL